jgi:hypothetical protein
MDLDEFYRRETKYIRKNENDAALAKTFDEQLSVLKKISSYVSGQYDTDEGFQHLREHLEKLEDERSGSKSPRNRVFYMALPPSVFTVVAKGLKKNVYSESGNHVCKQESSVGLRSTSPMQLGMALRTPAHGASRRHAHAPHRDSPDHADFPEFGPHDERRTTPRFVAWVACGYRIAEYRDASIPYAAGNASTMSNNDVREVLYNNSPTLILTTTLISLLRTL